MLEGNIRLGYMLAGNIRLGYMLEGKQKVRVYINQHI